MGRKGHWSDLQHGAWCAAAFALALGGAGCAANGAGGNANPGNTNTGVLLDPTNTMPGAPGGYAGAGGAATPVGPGSPTGGPGDVGAPGSSGAVTGVLPCDVETTLKSSCHTCHGATPIGGAPMSLMTLADFQQDYTVKSTTQLAGQTMKMYELAKIRLNREQGTLPMPQGNPLAAPDLAAMNAWLTAGAPAGTACAVSDPTVGGGAGAGDLGNGSTDPGRDPYGAADQCANDPSNFEPLVARDGETCYDFRTHGVSSTTDTSKFTVPTGESYNQFYFNVPWPAGTVLTRTGANFDNLPVLHHWLGFTSTAGTAAGTVQPNVTGTTLGESAELWGGWAVGGCNIVAPDDVGVRLPDSGKIMIQWHHYNNTGAPAPDGSAVQVCTVPKSMRANMAGMTFLGTENFNGPLGMPPGQSEFGGTCTNNSGAPITIFGFSPHEHLLGINMRSVVQRAAGGAPETVFDHPFLFDHQVNYMMDPPIVLQPGDKITSTCTFNNTTPANVAFGQSTKQEMCYQFALAYPYGALNNGVLSLIGATNTCW